MGIYWILQKLFLLHVPTYNCWPYFDIFFSSYNCSQSLIWTPKYLVVLQIFPSPTNYFLSFQMYHICKEIVFLPEKCVLSWKPTLCANYTITIPYKYKNRHRMTKSNNNKLVDRYYSHFIVFNNLSISCEGAKRRGLIKYCPQKVWMEIKVICKLRF